MLTNPPKETDFLMQALNSAMIGVFQIHIPQSQIFINNSLAEILGYEVGDLNTIRLKNWFEICHRDDLHFLTRLVAQLSGDNKNGFSRICRLKHKNGNWIDVQMNGKVTQYDDFGKPVQLTGTLFNISGLSVSKSDLNYRYEIEKLVSGISSDFVEMQFDSLDETINRALKKIGEFCKIDRSYLFLMQWDKQKVDNTHEWCAPGITPEIENLQDLPCSVIPWWMEQLWAKKHIYIHDVSKMPEEAAAEKEILEAQDIKSLLVVPILAKGELIGFMGFDSVTRFKDWHQSDIELLETVGNTIGHALAAKHNHDLLISAKEKAEESNRLKSAFLATMNHELRTPLHHILGFSDLIKGKNINAEQTELYATKIYDSGRTLLQIVEDILSLAIGNKEDVKVRQEAVRGTDLFVQQKSYMTEILATMNRENDILLNCSPDQKLLNSTILLDKNKVSQILINLFKNAVKFTPKGIIEYGLSLENNLLVFYIKDNGIGISDHQSDLIFEFFRQGEDMPTRRFSGLGIGLAICKNLVQILEGNIEVKSEKETGSTFTVSIPVKMVEDTEASNNHRKLTFQIPNYSSYRFLVVDDDPDSAFLIKNVLAKTNASILTTGNDLEALAYMGDSCFLDVILFNIKAYSETSLNMIREIDEKCCKCSIIGLVSHSFLEQKKDALKAGCVEVVSKPINTQLLFEAINKAIQRKKSRSGSCANGCDC